MGARRESDDLDIAPFTDVTVDFLLELGREAEEAECEFLAFVDCREGSVGAFV